LALTYIIELVLCEKKVSKKGNNFFPVKIRHTHPVAICVLGFLRFLVASSCLGLKQGDQIILF
jgi:hypothetical protein